MLKTGDYVVVNDGRDISLVLIEESAEDTDVVYLNRTLLAGVDERDTERLKTWVTARTADMLAAFTRPVIAIPDDGKLLPTIALGEDEDESDHSYHMQYYRIEGDTLVVALPYWETDEESEG